MSPRALRPAVNQHQHRILAVFPKAVRLHHEALHARAVRAVHPEFLERRHLVGAQHGVVEVRQRHRRAAAGRRAVNPGRLCAALLRVDQRLAIRRELHVVEVVVAADGDARLAAFHRLELDGLASAILGRKEQVGGIRRPGKTADPAVHVLRQVCDPARGPLQHPQPPAVAFIARPDLRAPRQILAVRRIQRPAIGAGIAGDLARAPAGDRDCE